MKTSTSRRLDHPMMEMFLRIKHPTMDPETITETLGLEPEECIKVGTSASETGGRRLHSESYWIADLTLPGLAEVVRWEMDTPEVRLTGDFPLRGGRAEIKQLLGATEYDFYILDWLRRLEGKQSFFSELIQAGGSATLLIQRNDQSSPVSLRKSLGLLEALGIGLEID